MISVVRNPPLDTRTVVIICRANSIRRPHYSWAFVPVSANFRRFVHRVGPTGLEKRSDVKRTIASVRLRFSLRIYVSDHFGKITGRIILFWVSVKLGWDFSDIFTKTKKLFSIQFNKTLVFRRDFETFVPNIFYPHWVDCTHFFVRPSLIIYVVFFLLTRLRSNSFHCIENNNKNNVNRYRNILYNYNRFDWGIEKARFSFRPQHVGDGHRSFYWHTIESKYISVLSNLWKISHHLRLKWVRFFFLTRIYRVTTISSRRD